MFQNNCCIEPRPFVSVSVCTMAIDYCHDRVMNRVLTSDREMFLNKVLVNILYIKILSSNNDAKTTFL